MVIRETDALWAADKFINYFERFNTIEMQVYDDYERFY